MSTPTPHLSIVLPVYRAESFLVRSLEALDLFLRGLACSAELVIVDDGSLDRSYAIASEWAEVSRPYAVRVLRHEQNQGKGGAVATGMLAAVGRFRIFLDVDLAYEPSQILRILEALEDGGDVAVACRVHPDSRYTISPAFFHYLYTRHLASRVINWGMRRTLIPHCRDSQAGLKGFRAEAAEAVFSRQIIRGFPFDVEALYLAEKLGLRIREVAVEYRYFNEPTTVVFLQDGLGMIRDVLRIRMHHLRGRYRLPVRDGGRRLIVNADDFGMTLPISRGILTAAQAGIVRSVSIMANAPDFEAAMDELLASHERPDVGFHATLTWGKPVLPPAEVATLVDREGRFLSRGMLLWRALRGRVSQEEAYRELHAQCERLARRWPTISHLDGHHHVHAFPTIAAAAERVAREFRIPCVRAPREGRWAGWRRPSLARLLVGSFAAASPKFWRACGFASTDHFAGFALSAGPALKQRWRDAVVRLPDGVTEIMVHPGYASQNDDAYNEQREQEIAVLTDPELLRTMQDAGIELASFSTPTM
jgi:dolichyl-phosphate beta-glucosyltransferase